MIYTESIQMPLNDAVSTKSANIAAHTRLEEICDLNDTMTRQCSGSRVIKDCKKLIKLRSLLAPMQLVFSHNKK